MDLRTERTKRSIYNAFIQLRTYKPLEKITVKELSELACRLEKWFCHYRMLWEKVSRESELRRIGDVVFWYCDLLRDMADKAEQRQK